MQVQACDSSGSSHYSLRDLFIATTIITVGVAWLNFNLQPGRQTPDASRLILAGGMIGAGGFYLAKRLQSGMLLGMIAMAALVHFWHAKSQLTVRRLEPVTELISIKTLALMLLGSIAAFAVDYWRTYGTSRSPASREALAAGQYALLLVLIGSFGLQVLNATFYGGNFWSSSRNWTLSTVPVQFLFQACGACIGAGFLAVPRKKLWGAILGVIVVTLCITEEKLPSPRAENGFFPPAPSFPAS